MEDKLSIFYNTLSANPNIKGLPGDFDTFQRTLQDPAKSQVFYNTLRSNPNIKGIPESYDDFVNGLALKMGGLPAPEEEKISYLGGLGKKFKAGMHSIGEMVTEMPQLAEALANLPMRWMADAATNKALRKGEIKPEVAKALKETDWLPKANFGQTMFAMPGQETLGEHIANSKVNQWFEDKAEELNDAVNRYDQTAEEYIKQGQYGKALGAITYGIAESLPATLAAAYVPGGAAVLGVGVAAQKYDEVKDNEDMSDYMKMADAVASGTFEWLFEKFGSREMGKFLTAYYKKAGGKGIEQAFKSPWMQNLIAKAYKKFGVWFAFVHEGVSELLTQMGQNAATKYSGEDPSVEIMDNTIESFLVGTGMGGTFSLTTYLAARMKKRQMERPKLSPEAIEINRYGEKLKFNGEDQITFANTKLGQKVFLTKQSDFNGDNLFIGYDAEELKAGNFDFSKVKPMFLKSSDIMDRMDVPYMEWLQNETAEFQMAAQNIQKQAVTAQSPYQPGQPIDYKGKKWMVSDVDTDGSITVDEMTEDGMGASEVITPDNFNQIAGNQPAPVVSDQGTVNTSTGPLTVPEEVKAQEQEAQKPQARKISDGKNELTITPINDQSYSVDKIFNTPEEAETLAKKLGKIYRKVDFKVNEKDNNDPFMPNEYTITATIKKVAPDEQQPGAPDEKLPQADKAQTASPVVDETAAVPTDGQVSTVQGEAGPVEGMELSLPSLEGKTTEELDGLISQLETGMKDLLDSGDLEKATKLRELIGTVIDYRNRDNADYNRAVSPDNPFAQKTPENLSEQPENVQAPESKTQVDITRANAQVDTNPSEAQKEAGNYKKGHVNIQGMDISIENAPGSIRRGTDEDGNDWAVMMNHPYGYFKRTKGKDGDQIDVIIGDKPNSRSAFVIDQVNPKTGKFDEHKVVIAVSSEEEAKEAYLSNYEPGWKGLGAITKMSIPELKAWKGTGKRVNKPVSPSMQVKNLTEKRKPFTPGPNSRTGKVLSRDPESFEEGVLQFFVGKGRVKTDDFVRYMGFSPFGKEGYIWAVKNDGVPFDVLHERLPNSFGRDGGIEQINEIIDILRKYPKYGMMLDALEKMQGEVKTPEQTEDVSYDDAEAGMELDLIQDEMDRAAEAVYDDPDVRMVVERFSEESGELDVDKLLSEINTNREFFISFVGLSDKQIDALTKIAQDEQRRRNSQNKEISQSPGSVSSQSREEIASGSAEGNAVQPGREEGKPAETGREVTGESTLQPKDDTDRLNDLLEEKKPEEKPVSKPAEKPSDETDRLNEMLSEEKPAEKPQEAEPPAKPQYTPEQQSQIDAINTDYNAQIAEKQKALAENKKAKGKAVAEAQDRQGLFGDTKYAGGPSMFSQDEQGFGLTPERIKAIEQPFKEKEAELNKQIASLRKEQKSKIGEVEGQQRLFAEEKQGEEIPKISVVKDNLTTDQFADVRPKEDDIPYKTAVDAYRNSSWDPEKRAKGEQQGYVEQVNSIIDDNSKIAISPEQVTLLKEEISRYKKGLIDKTIAYLSASSRTASSMITGPSNFPVERNRKAMEVLDKRRTELLEWDKKAQAAIKKAILNARSPEEIHSERWNSIKKELNSNITTIIGIDKGTEKGYSRPLFVNSLKGFIDRMAKNGQVDDVKAALEHITKVQEKLSKPIFTDKNSVWDNVKVAEAVRKNKETKATSGTGVLDEYIGAKIIDNPEIDRIQISMGEKPSSEVISALRAEAWNWSPSNKAWQRKNTPQALSSAKNILSKYYEKKATTPDSETVKFRIVGEQGAKGLEDAENVVANLIVAKEMEAKKLSPKEIFLATGWERGKDKFWRYETRDIKLKKDIDFISKLKVQNEAYTEEVPITDIIEDEELFNSYPQLKDVKLTFYNYGSYPDLYTGGFTNFEKKVIGIGTENLAKTQRSQSFFPGRTVRTSNRASLPALEKRDVYAYDRESLIADLSHEIQHFIQRIEGFAEGTTRTNAIPGSSPDEIYRVSGGEVEARNVQQRTKLSPEERKNYMLSATEDVARDQQKIIRDNVEQQDNSALFRISDNIYFSPIEKALEAIKQEKGTVQQWKSMLLKNGAKQAELDWMGWDTIEQIFGKTSDLTKPMLRDWIEENKVEIKEVQYSSDEERKDLTRNDFKIKNIHQIDDSSVYEITFTLFEQEYVEEYYAENEDQAIDIMVDDYNSPFHPGNEEMGNEPGATKYSKYTLPGGENYKELLLTLPKDKTDKRQTGIVRDMEGDVFTSNHWTEPNVLAHVRFNTRRSAEGRSILFIEEIQSDWAQQGKKEGFKDNKATEITIEKIDEDSFSYEVTFSDGTQSSVGKKIIGPKATKEQIEGYFYGIIQEKNNKAKNVNGAPDMPFKQTDQWAGLVLRRMIRYAIDNGFDAIAWTPGEAQNERYQLSKYVDRVEYEIHPHAIKGNESYGIDVYDKNGRPIVRENGLSQNDLETYVGKEVAQRIVNKEGEPNYHENLATGERKQIGGILKGLDLKVGGSGMTGFYDNILPSIANKIGKKFGSQVTKGEVYVKNDGDIKRSLSLNADINSEIGDWAYYWDGNEVIWDRSDNAEKLGFRRATEDDLELMVQIVHTFPITDAMFNSYREGVPLFRETPTSGKDLVNDLSDPSRRNIEMRGRIEILAQSLKTPITVVNSRADLPQEIQDYIKNKGLDKKRISGLWDASTETVYAVLDEIRSIDEISKVAFHEIVAHKGLKFLMGNEYDQLLSDIYDSMSPEEISRMEYLYNTTNPEVIAEEYLGHMAEDGVEPTLFQWVIARIRQFIRRFLKINYSANDIHSLLQESKKNLIQQAKPKQSDFEDPLEYLNAVTAWHGSGKSFNKFSNKKVGSDAGLRLMGFGLYFSDLKDLAEKYASKKADKEKYIARVESKLGKASSEWLEKALFKGRGDHREVKRFLLEKMLMYEGQPTTSNRIKRLLQYIEKNPLPKNRYLYEVLLAKGKSFESLDWLRENHPLTNAQTVKISDQMAKEGIKDAVLELAIWDVTPTKDIYRLLTKTLGSEKEASMFLSRAGIDGMKFTNNEGKSNYLVYSDQAITIKNKINFRITDPNTPVDPNKPKNGPPANILTKRGEKRAELWQNRMLSVRKWQNMIRAKGGVITEISNPYRQENLSHSIVKRAVEEYDEKYLVPLEKAAADIMAGTGMTYEEFNEYMQAKHAPERNREIAMQKMTQGSAGLTYEELKEAYEAGTLDNTWKEAIDNSVNAGMSTEEANKLRDKYESKMTPGQIDAFWKAVNEATKYTLDRWFADGFINVDTYIKIKKQYKYYVPLRNWQKTEADAMYEYQNEDVGKTVNPLRKAKGRKSRAADPMQYIVNMAHTAIVMGEKNRIKQHAARLVRDNKGMEDLHKFKKVYAVWDGTEDKATGKKNYVEVLDRPANDLFEKGHVLLKRDMSYTIRRAMSQAEEHIVEVYIGGDKYSMILPPDVSGALNKTPSRWDNIAYILRDMKIGIFTRWLSSNFTSKNPAFIILNQMRDLQYATLAHFVKGDIKEAKDFIKVLPKARRAIIQHLKGKGKASDPTYQMYLDFLRNGGETGYVHLKDVDQLEKEIRKDLARLTGRNTMLDKTVHAEILRNAGLWLEHMAIRSENLSRFGTYLVAKQQGLTDKEAAFKAKEITVNFNRKGRISSMMGAMYAFFNASVQGGENIIRMGKENKAKFFAIGAAGMSMGFLTALFNSLWGGGDDDDEGKGYAQINDYVKFNNLVIMIPGIEKHITIPLPHGFRWFNSLGVLAYQTAFAQDKNISKAVKDGLSNAFASVSPVNPVEFLDRDEQFTIRPVVPTFAIPFYDIAINQTFTGAPVHKEPFTQALNGRIANSALGLKNVNGMVKGFTDNLFALGGGDPQTGSKYYEDENGKIVPVSNIFDKNPSDIEHVIEYYLGGRGMFWNDLLKTSQNIIETSHLLATEDPTFKETIKEIDMNEFPILKSLVRQPWKESVYTRYYDIVDEIDNYKSMVNMRNKSLDLDQTPEEYIPEYQYKIDLLSDLKGDLRDIDEDIKGITDPKQIAELKDVQEMLVRNFIEAITKYDNR